MIRKQLKWAAVVVVAVLLLAQLYRPARTNPVAAPERHMRVHARLDPQVAAVFDRSCRDCHSHDTVWPWYSHIAPVSWVMIDDVNHGRSHFNLSDWASYDLKQADKLLDEICDEISDGAMPLKSYTWVHRGTRPSQREVETVCAWTRAERQRLASLGSGPSKERETEEDGEHSDHTH